MKNRIPKAVKAQAAKILTPNVIAKDFASQVANAQDTDVVTIPITTKRQASTTDAFRLTPVAGGADEVIIGWRGLAHFFMSFDAADVICYATAMKQLAYPENPEKWVTRARNWNVLRMTNTGGLETPVVPTDLLPPLPPTEANPIIHRGTNIVIPPSPRELEDRLLSTLLPR